MRRGRTAPRRAARGAGSRRPSTRRRSDPGTCPRPSGARARARSGAACRACGRCSAAGSARSSVSAVSTAQGTFLPTTSTPWLRRITARLSPSACGDGLALGDLGDHLGRLLEDGEPLGEQHRVVRQHLERRAGRGERRDERRVPVHDRADVGARLVDLGVQHGLEVHLGRQRHLVVREVELDHVVRVDLVERDALALDLHDVVALGATADVPEREVGIALEREDAAGPGDLLAQRLGRGGHQAARRSVGG